MSCRQTPGDETTAMMEDVDSDGIEAGKPVPGIQNLKSNTRLRLFSRCQYKPGFWHQGFGLAVVGSTTFVMLAQLGSGRFSLGLGHTGERLQGAPSDADQACSFSSEFGCPAQDLFADPEVHEVATTNLLKVGGNSFASDDKFMIRTIVFQGFHNITSELEKRAPALALELASSTLGKAEKDAVLATLALLSDTRVQNIGFVVGQAIRESLSTEREHLVRHIEAKLRPRLEEIIRLREDFVPVGLRKFWDKGHQWNMTLDLENIRMMQAFDGGINSDMFENLENVYAARLLNSRMSKESKAFGVVGGVVEQGRSLLDIIKLCAQALDVDVSLPLSATSLGGTLDFDSNVFSCQLQGVDGDPSVNFMKALFCPLKFGAQGLDALRAAPDMMDRVPARSLFENPKVHEVAVENIMLIGHGLLQPEDRALVRSTVDMGFRNLSVQLEERAPDVARELKLVPLRKLEFEAVIYSLSLLSDSLVESLGFDVLQAVHGSATSERIPLQEYVEQSLMPRADEMLLLRQELLSNSLRGLWDSAGHTWDATLDPDSIRLARAPASEGFADQLRSLQDVQSSGLRAGPLSQAEKVYGILGSVIEEGKALISMIELCAHLFESDLKVTQWAVSLAGTMDLESEPLSCEYRADTDRRLQFMQAMVCPLRYGLAGIDALRAKPNQTTGR